MSSRTKVPRIVLVAEGPTDQIVIEAIVESLVGDFELVLVQPEITALSSDFGKRGGGWKGVVRWCQEVGWLGGPSSYPDFENSELVIVHIDADVCDETEFSCRAPRSATGPPFSGTTSAIANYLVGMLGGVHSNLVFCIPHEATEAWLLPIFRNGVLDPEGVPDPANLFIRGIPRLCRSQGGRLKKVTANYQTVRKEIVNGWPLAVSNCSEAFRFDGLIRSLNL